MSEFSNVLFCRLTSDVLTLETIVETLEKKYVKFIVSYENASKQHFHCLICTDDTVEKNRRQNLRNFLKNEFSDIIGNQGYSITKTEAGTEQRIAKYVLKDGDYLYRGFDPELIQKLQKVSYKKYTSKEFRVALENINERYLTSDDSISNWMFDFVTLKVEYNQMLNRNTILNLANLMYCKKSVNNTYQFVNSLHNEFDRRLFPDR